MYELKYLSVYMAVVFIGLTPAVLIVLIVSIIRSLKNRPKKKKKKKSGNQLAEIKAISLGSDASAISGGLNTLGAKYMDLSTNSADEVIEILSNFAKNPNSQIETVTKIFSDLQSKNPGEKDRINDVVGKALKERK